MAIERNPFEGMQESVALDELEVKLNELSPDDEVEFVEIFNKSNTTVALSNYKFTDGIDFEDCLTKSSSFVADRSFLFSESHYSCPFL